VTDTTASLRLAREQLLARAKEHALRSAGQQTSIQDLTDRLLTRISVLEAARGELHGKPGEWVHLVGPDELCRRVQVVRMDDRYTCRTLKVPRRTLTRSLTYFEDVEGVPYTYGRWRVERMTWHLINDCRDNAKVSTEPLEARVKVGVQAPPPGGHAHPCGCRPAEPEEVIHGMKRVVCYCAEGPHPTLTPVRDVSAPPPIPPDVVAAVAAAASKIKPWGQLGDQVHYRDARGGCRPAWVTNQPVVGQGWRNLHVLYDSGARSAQHIQHRAPKETVGNGTGWHAVAECTS